MPIWERSAPMMSGDEASFWRWDTATARSRCGTLAAVSNCADGRVIGEYHCRKLLAGRGAIVIDERARSDGQGLGCPHRQIAPRPGGAQTGDFWRCVLARRQAAGHRFP